MPKGNKGLINHISNNNPPKRLQDQTENNNLPMDMEIFYKTPYHPCDISRLEIRNTYKETYEEQTESEPHGFKQITTENGNKMKIKKLTIAYTRDNNIRDMLIPSKLYQTNKTDVESTHRNIHNNNN